MSKSMILNGDSLNVLKTLDANSIDSVVTDPPYGLSFMGKAWDYDVPTTDLWREVFRVLKPGGHVLAFGGTRTYHRLVVAIEDAGFEIRDQIQWLYGSGFPKSMDISKAIDKAAGAEREVVGYKKSPDGRDYASEGAKDRGEYGGDNAFKRSGQSLEKLAITTPSTDDAKQWQGWGTALKPANEPICLARKPLSEKTVAANVLKHGTGGLNIDASRIGTDDKLTSGRHTTGDQQGPSGYKTTNRTEYVQNTEGRWPANVILDEDAAAVLDEQSGFSKDGVAVKRNSAGKNIFSETKKPTSQDQTYGGGGGASRFFKLIEGETCRNNANTAVTTSTQLSVLVDSVQDLVAILGVPEEVLSSDSTLPFILEMLTGLRSVNALNTETIQTIERRLKLELRLIEESLADLAKPAETQRQIDIITTTLDLWTSDFSVDRATYSNTQLNSEAGAKDLSVNRFMYCAKASKSERNAGLEGMPKRDAPGSKRSAPAEGRESALGAPRENFHPTVKPVKLMEYLIKLVTPPGGTVLDPFMGSGTTGVAAKSQGFEFVGIELNAEYTEIATKRIGSAS